MVSIHTSFSLYSINLGYSHSITNYIHQSENVSCMLKEILLLYSLKKVICLLRITGWVKFFYGTNYCKVKFLNANPNLILSHITSCVRHCHQLNWREPIVGLEWSLDYFKMSFWSPLTSYKALLRDWRETFQSSRRCRTCGPETRWRTLGRPSSAGCHLEGTVVPSSGAEENTMVNICIRKTANKTIIQLNQYTPLCVITV